MPKKVVGSMSEWSGVLKDLFRQIDDGSVTLEQVKDLVIHKKTAGELANKLIQLQKYCQPVSDEEAARFLSGKDASAIANLRRFSEKVFNGWNEEIFYKIENGFDFQIHAPAVGPCYKDWHDQKQWKLKNKESTRDSLVFWIPRLLPNSCSETANNQLKLMASRRKEYNLPENCLKDFGGASLNTLLILERFHRANERVPLQSYWIRTDTLHALGYRLCLGAFGEGGLDCHDWGWDGYGPAYLGCFPSGVWNL